MPKIRGGNIAKELIAVFEKYGLKKGDYPIVLLDAESFLSIHGQGIDSLYPEYAFRQMKLGDLTFAACSVSVQHQILKDQGLLEEGEDAAFIEQRKQFQLKYREIESNRMKELSKRFERE
jgi:hypothetical protein